MSKKYLHTLQILLLWCWKEEYGERERKKDRGQDNKAGLQLCISWIPFQDLKREIQQQPPSSVHKDIQIALEKFKNIRVCFLLSAHTMGIL